MARWAQTDAVDLSDRWRPRAKAAARWLAKARSVVDLGCGSMVLQPCLRPSQAYIPVDVAPRDARTLVLDLNRPSDLARLPEADAGALLGVLEYGYDAGGLIAALRGRYPQLVASFNLAQLGERAEDRQAHGWVNHFDRAELQALFAAHGFDVARARRLRGAREEWLFDLRRAPGGVGSPA
jgi:hypothetical protein